MIPALDICRSANLLMKQHGSAAHSIAKRRAEEIKAAGDETRHAAFVRVAESIKELGRHRPGSDQARH